ncbi:MAG: PEP-CTERM sorting domain-containing protein [Bryobacteraceae bacterium]
MSSVVAAPVACPTASLASYGAYTYPFNYCTQGPLYFGDFQFLETTNTGLITASDITMTPDGSDGFNIFTPLFNSNDPTRPYQRYLIYYVVDPSPIDAGDSLTLDPPTGGIQVTKYTCTDNTLTIGNPSDPSTYRCTIGNLDPYMIQVNTFNPPGSLTASVLYPQPATVVPTLMVIELQGVVQGLEGILSDSIVVPEPATYSLFVAGLLAVALRRRAL